MIVGIDLGTTNSLVAVYRNGRSEVIPNRLGRFLTPSIVAVDDNKEILVGELAREYGYLHPESAAKVFKRTMGTDKEYVLNDMKFLSEELSSFVLRSLKEDAEVYLNETIEEAIISVPAYFNDNQRKATKRAGELAGLNVSRIISEPTASAIAYGVTDNNMMERCMVFDLGGGTFDVSVLEYFRKIMEVHAIAGDNYLGGEDFTNVLMSIFALKNGFPLALLDHQSYSSLYKACEKAKCELKENETITVKAVLLVSAYASEDEVYALTSAIFEHTEDITLENAKGAELSVENATSVSTVPFHEGAARYYAEHGITVNTEE